MVHIDDRRKPDIKQVLVIGTSFAILLACVTWALDYPPFATLTGYIFGVLAMAAVVRISKAANGGN